MDSFETLPEQEDAKRLLRAALVEGPAHAYLFHGPPGSGKRRAALLFAGALIGDADRVVRRAHPDLYVLEPLGDQIRIDPVREMRRDLHMRPFEADRRVYLVFGAHAMNEDAADALLKDLEEPPEYAVIVLVADELGPLPETLRSRCQPVSFRRLSQRAIKSHLAARGLKGGELELAARVAAGRLDRAERLLAEKPRARRVAVIELARSVYLEPGFDAVRAAKQVTDLAHARGTEVRKAAEEAATGSETERELEQRLKRAERGAEREEIMDALDVLASWYRDLVVIAAGAEPAVLNCDRLEDLSREGEPGRSSPAEQAAGTVHVTRRSFGEYNVQAGLALEALFIKLRRDMTGAFGTVG